MKKVLLLSALAVPVLSFVNLAHAQESYPEIHNQPIRIHLLSAQDATPMAHMRVLLVAGYGKDDLKTQLWREDAISDAQGDIQLPQAMLNLPWIQILVAQAKPCIYIPDANGLSLERIRQDGLNAPNPCGLAQAAEKAGQLNFFVRKLPEFKKKASLQFSK